MIETIPHSALQCILSKLSAEDTVRLASCSKSLFQNIMTERGCCMIPIMRERLKYACWSLLQAGYCIQIRNTYASYIECQNQYRGMRFTYNPEILDFSKDISDAHDGFLERLKRHHDLTTRIHIDSIHTFGKLFDMYIIHPNARLQRTKCPAIRTRKIERHFALCARQLYYNLPP
jgi:hypothetical protein